VTDTSGTRIAVVPPAGASGVVRTRRYSVVDATQLTNWGLCLALYGPPGSGKTTLAGQAQDSEFAGQVVHIDAEGGARAIAHRKGLQVIRVMDSSPTQDNGLGWKIIEGDILDDLISGRLVAGTVILDNISEINAMCMYHTLRTTSRNIPPDARPDQKDWNTCTSAMLQLIRRFRDFSQASGTNVIFVAWDRLQEDRVTDIPKKDFALNPALANQLPGMLDIVGYLTIDGRGKRKITFEASTANAAKFRRSATEVANTIPLNIAYEFGTQAKPMADLIDCLKGGKKFPAERYAPTKSLAPSARPSSPAPATADAGGDAVRAAILGQSAAAT
jgi:hypothetical protein